MFFNQQNSTHLTVIVHSPSYTAILMDYNKRTTLSTLKAYTSFSGIHGEWGMGSSINSTAFFTTIKKWLTEHKCNQYSCALLMREPFISNKPLAEIPSVQQDNLYASIPLLFQVALFGKKYTIHFDTISNIDYAYSYAVAHSRYPHDHATKGRLFVHNTLLDKLSTEDEEKEIIAAYGSYQIGHI